MGDATCGHVTQDTASPTSPDWGDEDPDTGSSDAETDLHGRLDLLLDGLEHTVDTARTWPFHYGASLTSCVWAPVWQALVWAASDPALVDYTLIRLGVIRMGFTVIHLLRDMWLNRWVEGP